jgi:hypothetical protein
MYVGFALACAAGCAGKAQNGTPPSPAELAAIRQQITTANPQALVGVVTAVEPKGRPFAAVGDVPTADFHDGEPISFMDKKQDLLTHGIVRRILPDVVHVQWYPPSSDKRAPRVGDLAVRFRPSRVMMTPATAPTMMPEMAPTTAPTTAP